MAMFKHMVGDEAVICCRGLYKQVPLYSREGVLYAKITGGFVKLRHDGSTTRPEIKIDTLMVQGELYRDPLGRLLVEPLPGHLPLEPVRKSTLLGTVK